MCLGHAGEDEVLVDADADGSVPVGFGQAGHLDQLDAVHPAHGHRAADVEQALLALVVHADVVAPVALRQLLAGWDQLEAGSRRERFAESLGPELLDQIAHARLSAVLTVAELTEDLCDGTGELDRLVGGDKDVDVLGHALSIGEAATGQDVEAHLAGRVPRRPQADVVDLHPGTVLEAAGHADLELARQVRVLAVAGEEVRDRLRDGHRLDDLVGVHPADRAAADVARRVAARLDGRQADVMEALPDARDVLDPQPMQLDVLAGGQIGIAIAEDGAVDGTLRERVGGHSDLAELRSGELAAGGLDAQHERIAALALRVEAHPLEPLHLAGHRGDRCRPLLRVPVDDRLGDLEGVAFELPLLLLVQLTEMAVRVDEPQGALSAAELHPVGIVEVTGHQPWSPHSTLPVPDQRPARGSSPGATGLVVGAQPIER